MVEVDRRLENARHPLIIPPRFGDIPDVLTAREHWVVWEPAWEEDPADAAGGQWVQVPYHAVTGERVAPRSDQAFGVSFEAAMRAYREKPYAGIGFLLGDEDPFCVVDLSDVRETKDQLRRQARRVVDQMGSYTELSPSGTGLRIWVEGSLPPGGRRRDYIELYEGERFVPVTGCRWEGAPPVIGERQAALETLHRDLFPASPPRPSRTDRLPGLHVRDEDVLDAAFRGPTGYRLEALYVRGDTSILPGDRNGADLALCSLLGYYTGDDAVRLDRLFRGSALYRQKWDRPHYSDGLTYGAATVARALDGCIAFHPYPPPSQITTALAHGKGTTALLSVPPHFSSATEEGENPRDISTGSPHDVILERCDPLAFAEAQGRAQGLALRERVLTARQAASVLGISTRMLRRTIPAWRRFGRQSIGDRWLLSHLLEAQEMAGRDGIAAGG